MNTQTYTDKLIVTYCCNCGMPFGLSADFHKQRKEDARSFYCPRGHQQYYTHKERLEDKLRQAQQELTLAREDIDYWQSEAEEQAGRATVAKRQAAAAKGQLTKVKKRVGNGYCPCCNRQFINMQRHMAAKHPEYKEGDTPVPAAATPLPH